MVVTKSECKEWRRKVRETDTRITDIKDSVKYAESTVSNHVSGKCTHNVDVEPLSRYERSSEITITPEDCAFIRRTMRDENSIGFPELTNEFDISGSGINHHLRGKCSCDNDVEPVEKKLEYEHVDSDLCETIRDLYADLGVIERVVEKVGRDRKTVRYHAKGKCSHVDYDLVTDGEEESVNDGTQQMADNKCKELREDLLGDSSISSLSVKYGVGTDTVKRHARAECECSDGPVLLEVRGSDVAKDQYTRVTKGECLKAREMYWEDYKDSGTIGGFLGFDASDIVYHVTEECDHEFDDDTEYVFV
jgi:predicted transcriptional regulator